MKTRNLVIISVSTAVVITVVSVAVLLTWNCGGPPPAGISRMGTATAQQTPPEGSGSVPPVLEKIVFFPSSRRHDLLVPVPRLVSNTIPLDRQISDLVNILIQGPILQTGSGEDLTEAVRHTLPDRVLKNLPENALPAIPDAVTRAVEGKKRLLLKRLFLTEQGTAFLFFHPDLHHFHDGGVSGELATTYAIVNTVCVSFPSVQRVQLILEGTNEATLSGHVDITEPLYLDESYFALGGTDSQAGGGYSAGEANYRVTYRQPPAVKTIIIDAGHGGADTGTVGEVSGQELSERTVTAAIARKLRALIAGDNLLGGLGVKVVLTRGDDPRDAPDLGGRAALANREGGGLLISIHANTKPARNAFGVCTYVLRQGSGRAAADGAEERVVEYGGARDLRLLYFENAHTQNVNPLWDQDLALFIQWELNTALDQGNQTIREAPLRLLRGAAMPAVLVEAQFFADRRRDLSLLRDEYLNTIARSLLEGIKRYILEAD
jgi:N-acetylmuramoyl-L-alanine amidase